MSDTTASDPVPGEDTAGRADESPAPPSDVPDKQGVVAPLPGRRWRRVLAWVLLVLGCILMPLAVTGGWVRGTIFETEGFVAAVGPLAEEPAVQLAVATVITNQLFEALDLEERLRDLMPNRLGFLAVPLVNQLQEWTQAGAERLTYSSRFPRIWTAAVRGAHRTVVDFFNGTGRVQLGEGGTVELDLSELTSPLVGGLERVGIELPSDRFPILTSGKVPLVQVEGLERTGRLLSFLNKLFIVLPILTVVFLAGSVAVAVRRQKAAVRAGIGIMISMAVFEIILAFARTAMFDAVENAGRSTEVAAALWGNLTIALRSTTWALFFAGVLLLVHPQIIRVLKGDSMARMAGRATDMGLNTGGFGRWVSRQRRWLALGLLVIGFIVLVAWDRPGPGAIVAIAVVVILLEALVFFIARQSDLTSRAGPQG